MRFLSICSGIEAASVAWNPLGWKAIAFAEIEKFPSAVLAHHYPDVPNLGDMTKLPERIRNGEIEAPDILCGGTPCQAFSVAGLRRSLDDARGNLSLIFCEIADELDAVRLDNGDEPIVVFWENVPGVLNTKDNAFGCFLAGLAGEDEPLQPSGGKWTNAGAVFGPQRAVAWRVLDAQYFGVPQRRRRVFVVASARDGFDPAAVLFEFDGVRRDSAPSREAWEGIAPAVTSGAPNGSAAHGARSGSAKEGLAVTVCPTLRAGGNRTGGDRPPGTDVDTADSLITVSYAIQAGALRTNPNSGPDGVGVQSDHAYTLEARAEVQAVCCVTGDITHTLKSEGFDASEDGTGRGQPIVAFSCKDHVADAGEISPTLRSMDHDSSHANAGGQVAIARSLMPQNSGKDFKARQVEVLQPLMAGGPTTGNQGGDIIQSAMQVRRLTPRECERLQGFPDDYTLIPWRKRPANDCPDGPRYKALGNSWAIPCVYWIGKRIDQEIKRSQK